MRRARPGFTLIEMLVAMALIIFIMTILSEAFVAGLETFRQLKAVGDMQEKLRSVAIVMRRDLSADHFTPGQRMSDPINFINPPTKGFFRIQQGTPSMLEGLDGDGNPSFRATDHILHFSSVIRSNARREIQRQQFFANPLLDSTAPFPGRPGTATVNALGTQDPDPTWAEIAYFLKPTGTSAGGTPLFGLYRRQLWVLPYASQLNPSYPAFPPGGPPVGAIFTTKRFWRQLCQASCQAENGLANGDPNKYIFLHFNTEAELAKGYDPLSGQEAPGGPPMRRSLMNFYFDPSKAPAPLIPPGTFTLPYNLTDANPPQPVLYPDIKGVGRPIGGRDEDVADPGPPGYLGNPTWQGDDLLLTDVVSFVVQVCPDPNMTFGTADAFGDLLQVGGYPAPKTYPAPWDNLHIFDTAISASTPSPVRAVQITIRVWDVKTQQSRQISIIQDL